MSNKIIEIYDENDNLIEFIDDEHNVHWQKIFDKRGNEVGYCNCKTEFMEKRSYDENDNILKYTNSNGLRKEYKYDSMNMLIGVKKFDKYGNICIDEIINYI